MAKRGREEPELSEYEQERLKTIAENQARLVALGLADESEGSTPTPRTARRATVTPEPSRQSGRLAKQERPSYKELSYSEPSCSEAATSPPRCQLKAISIKQPYASGILAGAKCVENRTWGDASSRQPLPLPRDGSGLWLVLHSSAEKAKPDDPLVARLREAWPGMPAWSDLPTSCLLGCFRVARVVPLERLSPADPQAVGPWCWVIDEVVPFAAPVPNVRGMLGLWSSPVVRSLELPPLGTGTSGGGGGVGGGGVDGGGVDGAALGRGDPGGRGGGGGAAHRGHVKLCAQRQPAARPGAPRPLRPWQPCDARRTRRARRPTHVPARRRRPCTSRPASRRALDTLSTTTGAPCSSASAIPTCSRWRCSYPSTSSAPSQS